MKNISAIFLFSLFIILANLSVAQIANFYPNDIGIETDPSVLYIEKFDDGLVNILSRYNDVLNSAGMSVDTDIPAGSPGPNSIKMTSTTGGVKNGGHLFRRFSPGFDSVVYVRYYVKYPSISANFFHHEGIWFGGYNPATPWPNPQAGSCGLGNSRLSIAYEPVWQNTNPPGLDTYLYWGDMKSWNGGGSCYGNAMITQGDTGFGQPPVIGSYPAVAYDQWMCVEVMIKLNNPVNAYNGELAVWVNGVQAGHWGPGFPNGHWLKDKWYNNPLDPPFQGFRWRTDPNLNINWIWIEFYHDDPAAPSSYIKYDHVVMANKYIGPISNPNGIADNPLMNDLIQIIPNPSSGIMTVKTKDMNIDFIEIYDMPGKKVYRSYLNQSAINNIDISAYPKGMYFVKLYKGTDTYTRKIIIH